MNKSNTPNSTGSNDQESLENEKLFYMAYILNTQENIKNCLKILNPDENIGYKICIGLMARILKLYNSILSSFKECDITTTKILTRSLYETAISLEYLLVKFKKELFEEFVLTNAMRNRDLINGLKSHSKSGDKIVSSTIASLENDIKDDGLEISNLPKDRLSSWHRNISYKQMAAELGGESEYIFNVIYPVGSLSVHPSWSEIKRLHIFKEEGSNKFTSRLLADEKSYLEFSVVICTSLTVCEYYAKRFGDEKIVDYCKKLHEKFHENFNPKHDN